MFGCLISLLLRDFLSSIVIFSYLAGPIVLLVLRQDFPELKRPFKVKSHYLIGYGGFVCCSLLIYWSSFNNLIYLTALVFLIIISHNIFFNHRSSKLFNEIADSFFIILYLGAILTIKYLHKINLITFPIDNLFIILLAIFFCKLFLKKKVARQEIENNLNKINL